MNKLMSMEEAIKKNVFSGDTLTMSGFTTNRVPYAAINEIIRQRIDHLILLGGCLGGAADMLIGAGLVDVMINSYFANSGFTNVCRRFRAAVENKEIYFEDYSLDVQAMMFHAAALGLPYVPVKYMLGSDMQEKWGISREVRKTFDKLPNDKFILQKDPFNPEETYLLIPTPQIDVALIHAQKATAEGLTRIEGATYVDEDIALGAKRCIVICEEVVEEEYLRQQPDRNTLPSFMVDAVVHQPYGAFPSQVYNYYDYDREFLRMYDKVSRSHEDFMDFIRQWIDELKDHNALLDKLGSKRLLGLNICRGRGYRPARRQ